MNGSDFFILPQDMETTLINDLDGQTKKNLGKQLVLEALTKLQCADQQKVKFMEFLRNRLDKNSNGSGEISKIMHDLSEKSAIDLYTDDRVHGLLTQELHQGNVQSMIDIHYFIYQFYSEVQKSSDKVDSKITISYKKLISSQELKLFEDAENSFVLIHSFISITGDKDIASQDGSQEQSHDDKGKISVSFVIEVPARDCDAKPIAYADRSAQEDGKKALLLTAGIVFRISEVNENEVIILIHFAFLSTRIDYFR